MDVSVAPGRRLRGSIAAIASKSYAIRVLIASALADKPTRIYLNGGSKDIDAAVGALTALGADIAREQTGMLVSPQPPPAAPTVPCGESGTVARLLLPVAAALCAAATVTGEGSLMTRPFETLCNTMAQNGCVFQSRSLPVSFVSGIRPGRYSISGSESSQYISGLLFALPLLDGASELVLTTPLESSGYVDMTLAVLREFGVEVECGHASALPGVSPAACYAIRAGQRFMSPGAVTVEGDWSNAAFWLAAGVTVTGLNPASLQKDRAFTELCTASEVDAAEVPDLVPILAVNAAAKTGTTRIYNAGRLRLKESDRLETVSRMLSALGGDVKLHGDELIISGRGRLDGGVTDGCGDHRIVMSAAIAAGLCANRVIITNAQAVAKSYPGFFDDYNRLGGDARVIGVR